MNPTRIFAAALLALPFAAASSRAEEESPIPLLSATTESYDTFSKMVATITAAADPTGKQYPLREFEGLLEKHPGALDRTKPAHIAVWPNGMLEPLVATYIPTADHAALEKLLAAAPGSDALLIEPAGAYTRILSGTEIALKQNLDAARALDPAALKPGSAAKFTVRFDDPTRTMLKGVLAMGRLQLMQQGADLGDEATAEMMKSVFALYFDMLDGFIDGMEETTLSADIADEGIRFALRSSSKPGTTYAALIAKLPMPPAPLAEIYSHQSPVSIAGRMAEIGDPTLDTLTKLATLGSGVGVGGKMDPATLRKSMAMMKDMTPMYFSFDYDYDGELTARGTYMFPGEKDVPALYKSWVDLGREMGEEMAGEGKVYSAFKHDRTKSESGLAIDRFEYRLGDDFPPNPMFGDTMSMEYALSENRILFAMGGKGVAPLLEPREPAPLPDFLRPTDATVMIGHLDILSLVGTFAKVEVSHPAPHPPHTPIADPTPNSKILMRASLDGTMNFDLHIPLTLIRTLARIK